MNSFNSTNSAYTPIVAGVLIPARYAEYVASMPPQISINISPTLTYNNYNVYVFNTSTSIQLTNVQGRVPINVLAVGPGGNGYGNNQPFNGYKTYVGGGGGGGGQVIQKISYVNSNTSLTINVGQTNTENTTINELNIISSYGITATNSSGGNSSSGGGGGGAAGIGIVNQSFSNSVAGNGGNGYNGGGGGGGSKSDDPENPNEASLLRNGGNGGTGNGGENGSNGETATPSGTENNAGGNGGNGGGYINTKTYSLAGSLGTSLLYGTSGGGGRGIAVNPIIVPGIPYLNNNNNQIYYGGGGGGGQYNYTNYFGESNGINRSYGGDGGGGNGCFGNDSTDPENIPPDNGTANTGGGGGGGIYQSKNSGFIGGNGGSGIVILAVLTQYIV